MDWNPDLYRRFKAQRFAPFRDLLALIQPRASGRAIDLGCGTGEGTALLAQHLPLCSVHGIDNSASMLAKAQTLTSQQLTFEQRGIQALKGDWDVIFSNAALQWLPHHKALVTKIWSHLAPGGQLVVQVPANHGSFSNSLRQVVAQESPFSDALADFDLKISVRPLHEYAELLHGLGAQDMTVFEKIYPAVLPNSDAVFDWLSSTALRPYWAALPVDLHGAFGAAIRDRLSDHLGPGEVFFPYRRILFSAQSAPL